MTMAAIAALAAAVIWLAVPGAGQPRHRTAFAEERLERATNILLIGTDSPVSGAGENNETRADVLMLASCDPRRNRVSILSIPRDTLIEIPGYGQDRINMSNVYGGLALTKLMVERLTGLPVDRYVAVDFQAFVELVDLLGGVEVLVDKRMYYRDQSQDLLIDLQKGRQVLDGRQALGFVRYRRDPLGDLARVKRQQRLLRAVMDKAVEERLWMKVIALYRLKKRYVRTDLSLFDLYRLRNFGRGLASQTNLRLFTVPGFFFGPWWKADEKALAALVAGEFGTAGRISAVMKEDQ